MASVSFIRLRSVIPSRIDDFSKLIGDLTRFTRALDVQDSCGF